MSYHDDADRQATGIVEVVELLCDGGRVDPEEHDDDEKDDSAIMFDAIFDEFRCCCCRTSRFALLLMRLWSRVRVPSWGGTIRGW